MTATSSCSRTPPVATSADLNDQHRSDPATPTYDEARAVSKRR